MADARPGITRSPDSPATAATSRPWSCESELSKLVEEFLESLDLPILVEILVEYLEFLTLAERLDFLIPAEYPVFQTHGMRDGDALTNLLMRLQDPFQLVDTITPLTVPNQLLRILRDIFQNINGFGAPSSPTPPSPTSATSTTAGSSTTRWRSQRTIATMARTAGPNGRSA